jgi:prenyl protein peptidase
MGYFPIGVAEALQNLGLIAILFLGPLFEAGIAEGRWRDWIRLRGLGASIGSWIGWRNLVAVRCHSPFSNSNASNARTRVP